MTHSLLSEARYPNINHFPMENFWVNLFLRKFPQMTLHPNCWDYLREISRKICSTRFFFAITYWRVGRDPFKRVASHIHKCDMDHPCYCHITVMWLIRMWDMTHSYVWHDSFICAIWLIHMCDMTHSYVWHDSFICAIWLMDKYIHICIHIYIYIYINDKI